MTNPVGHLNDIVHQRHRLAILTVAAETDLVEFTYLRTTLDLSAGNLSRHLTVLEEAGLISVEKAFQGRRPKTWVRITRAGRRELTLEMTALQNLVVRHRASARPDQGAPGPDQARSAADHPAK